MQVLYETEVTPDQIDHLGHMNVAYYSANARRGAHRLLAELGLTGEGELTVLQRDTYVRHHREQLLGAPLAVRGGVLDATAEHVRLYEELVNTESGTPAATFVLTFELVDGATGRPVHIPGPVLDIATGRSVEVPEHGRPRSLSLDTDPTVAAPSPDRLRRLDLALRRPRTIGPELGEEGGTVGPGAVAELIWGGEPEPGRGFRPLEELPDGRPLGFATMETRATWTRLPRVGDRVQSFAADVDLRPKTSLGRHWLVDLDRDELLAVFSVVSLAFDVTNRRGVEIPDDVRARMERRLHRDLAGPDRLL